MGESVADISFADTLARDWQKAARVYARHGIHRVLFQNRVEKSKPQTTRPRDVRGGHF
jgi:hypothetical protein